MPALALCAGRATYQPIASSSRTFNKGEFRTSRARFDLGVPLPNHKGFVAYGTLHKARSRLFLSRLFLSLLCHPCFLFFLDPVFLFLCYPFHHGWYKCAARRAFSLLNHLPSKSISFKFRRLLSNHDYGHIQLLFSFPLNRLQLNFCV